jgi:hypothetical protein
MDTNTGKLIGAGVLFLLTIITGLIVSRSGRPLSTLLVTIHKLIAVGNIVLIGVIFSRLSKAGNGVMALEVIMIVVSAVLFLSLVATGSLLTREEMELPGIVLILHQVAPALAGISSIIALYLLGR